MRSIATKIRRAGLRISVRRGQRLPHFTSVIPLLLACGAMLFACGKQPESEEAEPKRKQTVLISEGDDVG